MAKKKGALRFISGVAGKAKIFITLLLIIQVILAVSSVLFALFLKDIINAAVEGSEQKLITAIIWFSSMVGVQIVFRAIERFLKEFTRSGLENSFKGRLFSRLLKKEYSKVTAVHSAEWMNRLTSDAVVVADGATEILPGLIGTAVRLVGAVIAIVILEPEFLYLVIPCGVLLVVFSTAFRRLLKRMHRNIQEKDGNLRAFMQERLESMVIVRTFAVQNDCLLESERHMSAHRSARLKRNNVTNLCNIAINVIIYGGYITCAVLCGFGIMRGTMSYGVFMAVLQLIAQIQAPFANISGYAPRYYAMLASAERLMEAENLPEEEQSVLSAEEVIKSYNGEVTAIGLSNASFTYPDGAQVLNGANIRICKGEYVAFTGQSGCGKSTVLKLLMGLYKLGGGEVYADCVNGRVALTAAWQRLFAYVPQGNLLMSGTVRDAVTLGDKSAAGDEKRLWSALKTACADEFVKGLEQGADTLLGERGSGLSEGQLQRLAIARAIFSNRPVLMLDECTSALDGETESRLLTNLKSLTGVTVLIVTHRPAALEVCDKLYEFSEGGKIVCKAGKA